MKYGKRGLSEEFSGVDQIGQTANREGRSDIEGVGNFLSQAGMAQLEALIQSEKSGMSITAEGAQ